MRRSSSGSSSLPIPVQATVATVVAILFVSLLPFSGALDIHHVFAAVDHDGHEHSDFDLCQWIHKHTSGSLVLDPPALRNLEQVRTNPFIFSPPSFSSPLIHTLGSRAPPGSCSSRLSFF